MQQDISTKQVMGSIPIPLPARSARANAWHSWLISDTVDLKSCWFRDTSGQAWMVMRDAVTSSPLVGNTGVQITSLNQPNLDVNLSSAVPEMRQHSCRVIASAIELAASWNAKGVVINPGKSNPVFPAPKKTLTDCFRWSLEVLLPIARRAGVELIVKNHPLSYLYRANDLRLFFDAFGWDQVGIGYDFANGHFAGEEPEAVLQPPRSPAGSVCRRHVATCVSPRANRYGYGAVREDRDDAAGRNS